METKYTNIEQQKSVSGTPPKLGKREVALADPDVMVKFISMYGPAKRCGCCNTHLPFENFNIQESDGKTYLSSYCSKCNREIRRRYRKQREMNKMAL